MIGKWFDQFIFVVLENTGYSQVQDCQFVKWFQQNGTIFENWHGVTHPSGPNYRAMLSGQIWSTNEFDGVKRDNVSQHVEYVVYNFKGTPAVRHDPFLDMNVETTKLPTDITTLTSDLVKPITYLGMDDSNNAHSGPLDLADRNTMEAINQFLTVKNDRTLFMVTFDEAFGAEYATNRVFTGFAGDMVHAGKEITLPMSHYNLAQFLADNWVVNLPPEADPQCSLCKGRNILEL